MSEHPLSHASPGGAPDRILLVHNRYKVAGGEDSMFESERDLLRSNGHRVETLEFDNAETDSLPKWRVARDAVWSPGAMESLSGKIRSFRPELVHFHNTFLRISPAGYWACKRLGVPVVQTLHNYRLMCLNALFLRDGKPCEDCVGKAIPWPGLVHRCYRESFAESGLAASVQIAHRVLGTNRHAVDGFVASSEFARSKFLQGGLERSKIFLKPNFVKDIGKGRRAGGYCLFAGRLSEEKGVASLMRAWASLDGNIPLKIAGGGPLESLMADRPRGVEYLGPRSREEIFSLVRDAVALIAPSECYEGGSPTVAVAEAFSAGVPVAGSRIGTMEEVVGEERGWLFSPRDPQDLAHAVRTLWNAPDERLRRGDAAREKYESSYSPQANYRILISIYRELIARRTAPERNGIEPHKGGTH